MYNPGQPTSGNEVSATDKSIDFLLLMFAGGINKVVLGRGVLCHSRDNGTVRNLEAHHRSLPSLKSAYSLTSNSLMRVLWVIFSEL
jgi:hypothetical protein